MQREWILKVILSTHFITGKNMACFIDQNVSMEFRC